MLVETVSHALQWILSNAPAISALAASAGALGALRIYRQKAALDRAKWLSSLYSRFYEAPDLKRIRKTLDENLPNAPQIVELVQAEDADLTDYLNFFELMAYLESCGQLRLRDIAALFDYYLRLLSKHKDVRKYVQEDRNGYGYLKKLMNRFPALDHE